MNRKTFIKTAGLFAAGISAGQNAFSFSNAGDFPVVRIPLAERKFSSKRIEEAINTFAKNVSNKELAWLFNNCFPNTLDTTVDFEIKNGRPDTYVITGDIDAMWLRDSSAQVWPYIQFAKEDKPLRELIAGVVNRQVQCILYDPYANAFYKDHSKISEWKDDVTEMKSGIHERKWEIDSLCYPIQLSHGYWKTTGDTSIFDADWKLAAATVIKTFKQQQRKENLGPYKFERRTTWATDGVALGGYGYPVAPVGLINSTFRPSDDATTFGYLIPSNFFAVASLKQIAAIANGVYKDAKLATEAASLATEVEKALAIHAYTMHPKFGKILAFETNGYFSYNLMDDANVPSLISLPYLNAIKAGDAVYQNTRRFLLSNSNPFFYQGKAAEGIGGPHSGINMIWPLSIIMRGLTSQNKKEIQHCIHLLTATHAGTGFMHESFHKDDATKFTRKWFAWANTLFGEFLWKVYGDNK